MYLKDTPQFNLLKKLYSLRNGNGVLGIAASKLETNTAILDELVADGYLKKIQRKKDEIKLGKPLADFLAIFITEKGITDWETYLASIPVPVPSPPSDEELLKANLRKKIKEGMALTQEEKDKLLLTLL